MLRDYYCAYDSRASLTPHSCVSLFQWSTNFTNISPRWFLFPLGLFTCWHLWSALLAPPVELQLCEGCEIPLLSPSERLGFEAFLSFFWTPCVFFESGTFFPPPSFIPCFFLYLADCFCLCWSGRIVLSVPQTGKSTNYYHTEPETANMVLLENDTVCDIFVDFSVIKSYILTLAVQCDNVIFRCYFQFLNELTGLFMKSKSSGTVALTMKKCVCNSCHKWWHGLGNSYRKNLTLFAEYCSMKYTILKDCFKITRH